MRRASWVLVGLGLAACAPAANESAAPQIIPAAEIRFLCADDAGPRVWLARQSGAGDELLSFERGRAAPARVIALTATEAGFDLAQDGKAIGAAALYPDANASPTFTPVRLASSLDLDGESITCLGRPGSHGIGFGGDGQRAHLYHDATDGFVLETIDANGAVTRRTKGTFQSGGESLTVVFEEEGGARTILYANYDAGAVLSHWRDGAKVRETAFSAFKSRPADVIGIIE
jgi:uncharacterized protein YodC (DUF2158 family)